LTIDIKQQQLQHSLTLFVILISLKETGRSHLRIIIIMLWSRRSLLKVNASIVVVRFVILLIAISSSVAEVSASSDGGSGSTCDANTIAKLQNSALVFIKPHANTQATQDLVVDKLTSAGIKILTSVDIGGKEIDEKGLIDQHYYSIASKATILPPEEIPVPVEQFQEEFGESWDQVLKDGRAVNAVQACEKFGCTPTQLNDAWSKVPAVKFGGGFYCGMCRLEERINTHTHLLHYQHSLLCCVLFFLYSSDVSE
jgi:hypothetical protein